MVLFYLLCVGSSHQVGAKIKNHLVLWNLFVSVTLLTYQFFAYPLIMTIFPTNKMTKSYLPCDLEDSRAPNRTLMTSEIDHPQLLCLPQYHSLVMDGTNRLQVFSGDEPPRDAQPHGAIDRKLLCQHVTTRCGRWEPVRRAKRMVKLLGKMGDTPPAIGEP